MSSPRPFSLLTFVLVALLGGCTTAPAPLADDEYQPPAATSATAAVKGSRVTEGGVFGDVHTGYVYMIDLKSVRDAADNWDKDIVLTPGKHTIMVEYRYSNFKGRTTLTLNASPGTSYQLMIKPSRESTVEVRRFCEFWIADAAGQPVTKVQRAQVMGGKKGTIFNVPT